MILTTGRYLMICLCLVRGALTSSAEAPFKFESTPGKLSKDIVPRHYAIHLLPDLEKLTTSGKVDIKIEVLKSARQIALNALDMEITKAAITAPKTIPLEPRPDEKAQTVSFALPETLAPGKYVLTIEFTGHLREQAQGLYYVRYPSGAGKKRMLATQMEPADARRMFPCWDEPAFRASFEPTVLVPKKYLAVSNMPIKSEKSLDGDLKEVHFDATPPMASYLVVLVTGELETLEDSFEGVKLRIVTTEGKKEQGRYALESAKKILGYYNQYFGIKYPLPKLDSIAVPGGFGGAMENWGGIVYNETALLYDPKISPLQTRQGVFSVMAHEMAHQWFGDLVTTAWWDNLWLNEGFASWMGTKCSDHFNPDWQLWLRAGGSKSAVMSSDSLRSTHPILQPVLNESQANDAFDQITYTKGESFLRMLENYLGEEKFRDGMRLYMSRHRYSNTTTEDLWVALEKASGKPVRALSAGWTEQPGLPVVNVSSTCEGGKTVVRLEQERFTVRDPGAKPLQWMVPVGLADLTRPNSTRVELLADKSASVVFPNCDGVIKANFGDAGYYRVSYSPEMLEKVRSRFHSLKAEDRLNLLGDTWALVTAQRAGAASYLDLVASLGSERNAAIWQDVLRRLELIDTLQRGQTGRSAFRAWAIQIVRPQLQRLGWEAEPNEPAPDTLLRSSVISLLGAFGDREVVAEAKSRFEKFLAQPESLPPNLRPCITGIVGRYSDRAVYDRLHDLARSTKRTDERRRYYNAMASALDPSLAALTLPISLTDENIPQEAIWLVSTVAHSGEQPELAWQFAQEHMTQLMGRIEEYERNMYVPSIMSAFSDADRADELERYVNEKVSPNGATKARETAEGMRLRADLKQRELPVVDHWIAAHSHRID
ncbi:MAG: aminopeptidase [Verrucomicrobia bacterium]|nr:MAG: aminopeptidase [Verrucomicrobiota bacterium]